MALLLNKQSEAEQIYVQNKFYYHAIEMHVNGYRWERALKLARDFKCHLELVVYFRNKYLKRIGKEETGTMAARKRSARILMGIFNERKSKMRRIVCPCWPERSFDKLQDTVNY